ncbi:nucleotidyltransferase family protein [Rhodovibrio salinarum]|uniref:Nucleotidyltransferase family protein n=1 Tax=Rhodovibrio salinarum TaxID=1087 RepID=A0A934V2N7_9PROT|nr:nucleotidyltransferase family protein [Rhodovibrio salinarum]MBK1699310.1 nucleotidyltransferase family protein [Rhodovibrio salinarum]
MSEPTSAAPQSTVDATAAPKTAMVLAAGYGKRMRPITDETPKPMVEVMGRPMIDRTLDRLADAGVERVVVNSHHLADKLESHLAARSGPPAIEISREADTPLDTGAGVLNALDKLGEEHFYVLNGDIFWLDGCVPALIRLAQHWAPEKMDALVLLSATAEAIGYAGPGDFQMDIQGRVRRRQEFEVAPFCFAGVQILHRRLFDYAPEGSFSLNLLFDQAEGSERLFGLRHDGLWFHIGTPHDIETAEEVLYDLGFRTNRPEERVS